MAITKRIRFEILRRDDYTCRYCRSKENPLTVDHVVPTALGGTDLPDNLAAACKDCNAGKSSASADSSMVADVRDGAIRHAELIRQAYAVLVERMGLRDDYLDEFEEAYGYVLPDDDWRNTVCRWFEMGVPIEILTDAARIASRNTKSFYGDGRFRYMCKIVWNQVHAVNEAVELKGALDGAFMTDEALTDERIAAHSKGWETGREYGYNEGFNFARRIWETHDFITMQLHNVVEKSFPRQAAHYRGELDNSVAMISTGAIPTVAPDPWTVAADF